ncbi:MAG: hypothetical protein COZ18_04870 [Flexibacter sp. CG_4_10_14_3_um_filter_32_15]|nr:MAG: hypothetical protein COZ18_04870 [Flexibacter sp. CG_4_10_14_3_um_filter_32_15]
MKKIVFLLSSFFLFSCNLSETNKKVTVDKDKGVIKNEENKNLINDPRSPNPSSELAVLMRDMWEYADTLKTAIADKNTNSLPEYRPAFSTIFRATPTDEHTKSPVFDAMAKIMLQKLENVYQNAAENKEQSVQVEGFNLFVKSCLQCHEQQCPGPVSKISKLMIKE